MLSVRAVAVLPEPLVELVLAAVVEPVPAAVVEHVLAAVLEHVLVLLFAMLAFATVLDFVLEFESAGAGGVEAVTSAVLATHAVSQSWCDRY
jgi:hypothetical protein